MGVDPKYEDYDTTSASYDAHRRPLGVATIRAILETGGIYLDDARVLDAGCGTGAYLAAFATHAKALEGLEPSSGMLAKAKQKLVDRANVTLHEGSIGAMPFEDARFDAVIVNQVLHHLDDGRDRAFPGLARALAEIRRVLRRGGGVVVNTCSQLQVEEGAWYTALVPGAVARLAARYVPIADLERMMKNAGLEVGGVEVPLGERFAGDASLDPAGPLDKRFRDSDSLWALATPAELEAALGELRGMIDRGEADAFVARRDAAQRAIGQATFVHAWRR